MSTVAILSASPPRYPARPPYHPPERFPELPADEPLDPENRVWTAVREALAWAGGDRERLGRPDWNPLGGLIRPGETVFIKPNMIAHRHALRDEWEPVITHGAVLRPVIEYVHRALEGRGRILLGDGPQTDSQWDAIVERMGLREICRHYAGRRGFTVELLDLRDEYWVERDGVYVERKALRGDPEGRVAFDLGRHSQFAPLDGRGRRYYGAFYDVEETNRHHSGGRHEYALSASPIAADVFISVPKLKTHKKCGLTVNLKGLVGINANKNWLPHYVIGPPEQGGDQFDRGGVKARAENALVLAMKRRLLAGHPAALRLARAGKQFAYRVFGGTEDVVRSGNWHGNDTVWRMCLDLNRALLYGNPDGTLREAGPRKRFFSVVDGIVAMEGNGPVAGSARPLGVVLAGGDPAAVDAVCARLMGFDWQKLPIVRHAFEPHALPVAGCAYEQIETVGPGHPWQGRLAAWPADAGFHVEPHFGWKGHIELR